MRNVNRLQRMSRWLQYRRAACGHRRGGRSAITTATIVALTLGGVCAGGRLEAADLYWAPGAGAGGSGSWDDSQSFWSATADGSEPKSPWDNLLTDNVAIFGGSAGTVTTAAAVATNRIRFDTTDYLLAGSGGNSITLNGTAPQILLGTNVAAEISAPLAGAAGFATGPTSGAAGSVLTLSGTSTISSGTVTFGVGEVVIATTGSLASGAIDVGTNAAGQTATLRIKAGGAVNTAANSMTIGRSTIPTASVIQEGGQVTMTTGQILLANAGNSSTTYATGPASYTLQDGSITTNLINVGRNGPATFTQSGGTVSATANGSGIVIGDLGDGSYSLTGGSVSVIGGSNADIWVGSRGGAGTLEINGADVVMRVRRSLNLANNDRNSTTAKGSATVTLTQGTLAVNGILKGRQNIANGYGEVSFTLSGGTLRPYDNNATFGSTESARNFDITISGTGSVISGLDDRATPVARTVDMYANLVGSGAVTLSGGTFNLRGANTHSGTMTINATTTVALTASGSLDSALTVSAGGTFSISSLTDASTVLRSLAGAGSVDLGGKTLTLGDATSTTFSGVISGAGGSLVKQGSGTLTLSGENTFSGDLTVAAGTLKLAAGGSVASSPRIIVGDADSTAAVLDISDQSVFTIDAGRTLTGKGKVLSQAGTELVVAGLFSPGNSPGLFEYDGGLTTLSGTTLLEVWGESRGVAGGYDAVNVINGGTLSLGGLLQLDFDQTFADGTVFNLFTPDQTASLDNTFTAITMVGSAYADLAFTEDGSTGFWRTNTGAANQSMTFDSGTGQLTISVVPEPGTIVLLGIGAGLALLRRRGYSFDVPTSR